MRDFASATCSELADDVRHGQASARELVEASLARIAAHDERVNAFTDVLAERALARADTLDEARARGQTLGPLAGVPFAGPITFVCLVLAIVQVGPNIVMIPVIIWTWMYLPVLHAGLFTVYTVPLLLLDNVLRPILMARGLPTPMAVIVAGVICGTLAGGLIGLFVGPVVLSVFYDLLVAWIASGSKTDDEASQPSP